MFKFFLAAALASFSLGSGAAAQSVGLGTGPQGTLTYQIGAAVAKILSEKGGLQARVQPLSGDETLIQRVNSGEVDFGFASMLELHDAFHGVGAFGKGANAQLRIVAVIFPIRVGLFVRADSSIKSVKDLKGKVVAYGFDNQQTVRKTVDAMLATEGMSIKDLKTVMVPNLILGVDEFIAGRVDVTTFALGSAKVSEADAVLGGVRYLSLSNTPAALAGLQKEFPNAYLSRVEPANNLPGVAQPIVTMFYDYAMFTHANLSAGRVNTVAALIAENKDALAQGQPLFKDMKSERLFSKTNVPYHDGATAYYREKGIEEAQ